MARLGIVQIHAAADLSENLAVIARFAAEAAENGCTALCFPECFLTGYDPENAAKKVLSREDSVLDAVSDTARQWGMDLLIGFQEAEAEKRYITHGIFRPDGTRDYYRKTHLGEKEARFFTPGDRLDVFCLSCGIPFGFQLCVETHFPEITQTLSLKGAEVIFAPHAVPGGDRKAIWAKYIPARSYDNRVYFACCNAFGGLYVTDPAGNCLGSCFDAEPSLLVWEADRELVSRYRSDDSHRFRYFPSRRRPELYETGGT